MLTIYTAPQIKEIESLTCQEQDIESLQLMERAAQVFTTWFSSTFKDKSNTIHIFCGTGNNGGDGLAIARLLHISGYKPVVYTVSVSQEKSKDNELNLEKLKSYPSVVVKSLNFDSLLLPEISHEDIIVDAIFGTGLNRPVDLLWKKLFDLINSLSNYKISIDIPSGLFTDSVSYGMAVKSDFIFGFEYPKFCYFLSENATYIKKWKVESIQLSKNIPSNITSTKFVLDRIDIKNVLRARNKFSYKNNFGHLLIIAGSSNMCGAAILSAKSSMRSGSGLVSTVSNSDCITSINQLFPESIVHDYSEFFPLLLNKYDAYCIGPGMKGIDNLEAMLNKCFTSNLPGILDAEAINTLATSPHLLKKIPKNTILTPHIGEFDKLVNQKFTSSIDRLNFASEFAKKNRIIIVLKGANSCITHSDGRQYFNTTGNQGMATAGSGDVLSGIIGSLLSQSYEPLQAALIGTYMHGLAGDLALKNQSFESLIASDIIENLGSAFKELEPKELF